MILLQLILDGVFKEVHNFRPVSGRGLQKLIRYARVSLKLWDLKVVKDLKIIFSNHLSNKMVRPLLHP